MTPELEQKLYNKYSALYRGRNMSIKENLMPFGFECGNGWYSIIDKLSAELTALNKKYKCSDTCFATQVKEKFGVLCFYISSGTEEHYAAIEKATRQSSRTCELCGHKATLREINGWLQTLCDKCFKQRRKT